MNSINQIGFAISTFISLFLALHAFYTIKHLSIPANQQTYWLRSVIFFFMYYLFLYAGSMGYPVFIWFANIALVYCLSCLYFLLRCMHQSVSEDLILINRVFILAFAAEFIVFLLFDMLYVYRYYMVGGTVCVLTGLQIREVVKLIKIDTASHLKIIGLLLSCILILFVVRLFNFNESSHVQYLYQEDMIASFIRLMLTLCYVGILIAINRYFLKKAH